MSSRRGHSGVRTRGGYPKRQALNYLLGQMEELGYLRRVEDSADQRFKRIRLTARGRAAGAAMREIVLEIEAEWTQKLGPRRFAELRDLLARLSDQSTS